jgi:mono/diheme cytochrome c family protein
LISSAIFGVKSGATDCGRPMLRALKHSHAAPLQAFWSGLVGMFGLLAGGAALAVDPQATYKGEIRPLLEKYCFDCHADGEAKGKFAMDEFKDLSGHLKDRKHWLAIWRNLRSQIMPPSDKDQPSSAEGKKLLAWIEQEVFKMDPAPPDPGRVTIRRLNRTEYQNAVFDLLGVEYDTREVFPADDTGYGFDNIGDVLSISPLLMEKYIAAADEVVALALPEGAAAQVPRVDIAGTDLKASDDPKTSGDWLPFAAKRQVKVDQEIRWDGEYQIKLEYAIRGATEATTDEAKLDVSAAGSKVAAVTMGWDQRRVIELTGKVALKAGRQTIAVDLTPLRRPKPGEEELFLTVQRIIVQGPLGGEQREYAKGYRMIFVDGDAPAEAAARERYARKIMRSFVSRAFRKPLDEPTIDRLVAIVNEVSRRPGKSFQDGIKQAIATCLASPRFLFRVEIQPEPNNPARIVPLDEYSLASRMSFFIWGSVPDDELLSLAFNHKLRANLRQQVDRMLADPRSKRLVRNFVGQWLQVRDVETIAINARNILGLGSNREAAQVFDPRLRSDMQQETELLFDFILRENRPAEELISARYGFLNERLAGFYGIRGVSGEEFRPVDFTEHPERGGLLTQGAVLMVTSNPTRTSAVKRGLFVLDNLLGSPPPPPPPGIPKLEDAADAGNANPTMREMMEIHRKKPECRGCHARMDPIGLGLENYNALGQFRDKERGKPIDAAGKLVTGEKFADVAELKEILAGKRKQDFYRCLAEKLLTYAIGRGMEYYDATTIDQLAARLEKNHGKMRELIQGIVESAPFQKRRGDE